MGNHKDGKPKENAQEEVALINAHAQEVSTEIEASSHLRMADKNILAQQISAAGQKDAAAINASAQLKIAQVKNDPLTLDSNEAKAYELIKKTGILTDLSSFEVKIAAGDKEAIKDVLSLENALKKDGKDLIADGKITSKTISAAQGLIGENSEAILKYEEVLDKLSAKSPTAQGAKVHNSVIEH